MPRTLAEIKYIAAEIRERIYVKRENMNALPGTPFAHFISQNIPHKTIYDAYGTPREVSKPFSGVFTFKILQRNLRTVLLIGEQHQRPVSNPNCTRILTFLLELFTQNTKRAPDTFNIDFFIEIGQKSNVLNWKDKLIKTRRAFIAGQPIGSNIVDIYADDKLSQINTIMDWVEPCIIYNRIRYQYLKELYTYLRVPPIRIKELARSAPHIYPKELENRCSKNVKYHWFDVNNPLESFHTDSLIYDIIQLHRENKRFIQPWQIPPIIKKYEDLELILTTNKTIIKEAKNAGISMEKLIDYFWLFQEENLILYPKKGPMHHMGLFPDWMYNVYLSARTCIELYLFCRLMKKQPNWYKNEIVYAGNFHIQHLEDMLIDNDFYEIKDIPYSSECFQNTSFDQMIHPRAVPRTVRLRALLE